MSDKQTSYSQYLHPRFWPTWLGLGMLRIISWLPMRLQILIGGSMGWLLCRLSRRARGIAITNLEMCFPELSDTERRQLLRKSYISLGISLIETANSWWRSPRNLKKHYTINGREHLDTALREGNGVILLSAHFTTLEIGGRMLNMEIPIHPMYREQNNPLFNHIMQTSRDRYFRSTIHRNNIRQLVSCLKDNETVWYAPDQNYGGKNHIYAPFFGVEAATNTATSRLVKITGASIIPFMQVRKGSRYEITLFPALTNVNGEDTLEDTRKVNAELERMIRLAPEQYLWVHRRFKNRPDSPLPFY